MTLTADIYSRLKHKSQIEKDVVRFAKETIATSINNGLQVKDLVDYYHTTFTDLNFDNTSFKQSIETHKDKYPENSLKTYYFYQIVMNANLFENEKNLVKNKQLNREAKLNFLVKLHLLKQRIEAFGITESAIREKADFLLEGTESTEDEKSLPQLIAEEHGYSEQEFEATLNRLNTNFISDDKLLAKYLNATNNYYLEEKSPEKKAKLELCQKALTTGDYPEVTASMKIEKFKEVLRQNSEVISARQDNAFMTFAKALGVLAATIFGAGIGGYYAYQNLFGKYKTTGSIYVEKVDHITSQIDQVRSLR